jgi:uncharacterized protein
MQTNAPLMASIAQAGIVSLIVLALAAPALFRRRFGLVLLAWLTAFVDTFASDWPRFLGTPLSIIHGNWDWNGKLFDLLCLICIAAIFVATGLFSREDMGLKLRQRPGSWRAALFVIVPALIVIDAVVLYFAPHAGFTAEDVAYQMTLPGIVEEIFWRGILLAIFDRMFAPNLTILGAKVGYGAVATSLAFAAVHTFEVDRALHIRFFVLYGSSPLVGALFGAWLRARSGSVALPALAHNISNTVTTVVPAIL